MTDLNSDREVLAATIWGEARGEYMVGKRAVACVVLNRVRLSPHKPMFGDGTIKGACLFPWQFSCWNEGPGNESQRPALLVLDWQKTGNPDSVMATCLSVADAACAGSLVDMTHGATHYKTTVLPWPHAWGDEKPPLVIIGHHAFYKID